MQQKVARRVHRRCGPPQDKNKRDINTGVRLRVNYIATKVPHNMANAVNQTNKRKEMDSIRS